MDHYVADQEGGYLDDESQEEFEEEEEEEEEYVDEMQGVSPPPDRVSGTEPSTSRGGGYQEEREKERRASQEATKAASFKDGDSESERRWNREEVEGLCCPICMEPWSNDGVHQPSCLPCGHLYGISCIRKWLQQRKNSGKCPQCNKKCKLEDIRRIYGSRVIVIDEHSQKDADWHRKEVEWSKKEAEWRSREANLCEKLLQLTERTSYLERLLGDGESKSPKVAAACHSWHRRWECGSNLGSDFGTLASSCSFVLKEELRVDGGRFFDVDASNQILVIVQRPAGIGVLDAVTKMSLISPHAHENIFLPSTVKAVKDLRVSPFGGFALLASLGKKLSVLSMESNNMILSYDLPAAAWSCSWDVSCQYYIYAGLQNGMLLVFDTRQTGRPLESRNGLTSNPVHTIHSLSAPVVSSGVSTVLTASSVGLCQWNIGAAQEQLLLIPETEGQGVCISFAYCHCTDNIVTTFRPRVDMCNETAVSQPILSSSSAVGPCAQGSHVHFERRDGSLVKLGSTCANVPIIRLPKSAIVGLENHCSLLAYGDEILPSYSRFKVHFFLQNGLAELLERGQYAIILFGTLVRMVSISEN
ncbi:hypothetical protein Nepgr_011688 [Nepenthes gracilis]|uniref:RING-type domain-containing protein n=1 Tax=Nepenthes gracilis TaxID=150966 RepID=A0AAD3SEV1_NEPGR|nr:hypothetical protein Nepgr_011688 [Nepenthes gracilis]